MPAIPPFILKKLYVKGSMHATEDGFALELKNTIAPGEILALAGVDLDGEPADPKQVSVVLPESDPRPMAEISDQNPLPFPLGAAITLHVADRTVEPGPHEVAIHAVVRDIGPLTIPVSDVTD